MGNNSSSAGYYRLRRRPPSDHSQAQPLLADYIDNKSVKAQNSDLNLESQVNALERRVATLEPFGSEVKKQEEHIQKLEKKNAALEKQVSELAAIIAELNDKQKIEAETRKQMGNSGDSSIPNLIDMDHQPSTSTTTNINPSNNVTRISQLSENMNPVKEKPAVPAARIENYCLVLNDLIGCVMVVIFLVTFIIGLLL